MSLSCDCGFDDFDWYYNVHPDCAPLRTRRSRRCLSCKALIHVGDDCVLVFRWREPKTIIEERIYGDGGEVPMRDRYLCETCGGLYWAIDDLGMCCDIEKPIKDQIAEYRREEAAAEARYKKYQRS